LSAVVRRFASDNVHDERADGDDPIADPAAGLVIKLTGAPERRRRGGARTPQPVVPIWTLPEKRPKRKLSAKARAAISRAQKKRWAKLKAE
jgi:hypothetical protein